jgi:hypothetical protein
VRFFFDVVSPVGIVHDAVEVCCFTLFGLFVAGTDPNDLDRTPNDPDDDDDPEEQ